MALVVQIGANVGSAIKGIEEVTLTLKEQRAVLASLQKEYASLSTQQVKSRIGQDIAADIKIAQQEIKRLEAGSVNSFSEIGRSATKGLSAVRQLAYILPGIGLAGIFSAAFTAISSVVEELFSLSSGFSSSEIAAAQFRQALDDIADSADNLKKKLDFQSDIAKLVDQLSGFKGEDLSIRDLGRRSEDATKIITSEEQIQQGLKKTVDRMKDFAKEALQLGVASDKFKQLALTFQDSKNIPKSLIEGLPEKEKVFANDYVDVLKKLEDSKKRSSDAQAIIGKNFIQQQIDEQTKQDNLNKEALAKGEKFVNDTIAKGKKIASFFEGRRVVPTFGIFDTKQEQLQKAIDVTKKFEAGTLEIIFNKVEIPSLESQTIKAVNDAIAGIGKKDTFSKILNEPLKLTVSATPGKGILNDIEGIKAVGDQSKKTLEDIQANAEQTAQIIGSTLAPAFQDMFSAIEQGKAPLDAFFKGLVRSVEQLISRLIAAAAEALILSALTAGTSNPIGFLSAFKGILGFRATGGPVSAGGPYIVGERGPELFIPSSSGNIIPNNNTSGLQGMAAQMIRVEVTGRLSGRDMVLQQARQQQFNDRNV